MKKWIKKPKKNPCKSCQHAPMKTDFCMIHCETFEEAFLYMGLMETPEANYERS